MLMVPSHSNAHARLPKRWTTTRFLSSFYGISAVLFIASGSGILVPVAILLTMMWVEGFHNVVAAGFENLAVFILTLGSVIGGLLFVLGLWMIDIYLASCRRC